MVHPSKNKGNNYERELVNYAVSEGITSKRAYASNGQSLGMHEEVDCVIGGFRIQAKRRKNIAAHLIPSEHVDCVATRPDRGETLVIMRWEDWIELVKGSNDNSVQVARKSVERL